MDTWLLFFLCSRAPNVATGQAQGFSILELVTALSILTILTTVSLTGIGGSGGILGAIKIAEIDEAKALLADTLKDAMRS